jgi:hypothetical protein
MSPLPFKEYFRHISLSFLLKEFSVAFAVIFLKSHLVEDDVVCIAGILESHVGANIVPTSSWRGEHSAPESGTKGAFLAHTHY